MASSLTIHSFDRMLMMFTPIFIGFVTAIFGALRAQIFPTRLGASTVANRLGLGPLMLVKAITRFGTSAVIHARGPRLAPSS